MKRMWRERNSRHSREWLKARRGWREVDLEKISYVYPDRAELVRDVARSNVSIVATDLKVSKTILDQVLKDYEDSLKEASTL